MTVNLLYPLYWRQRLDVYGHGPTEFRYTLEGDRLTAVSMEESGTDAPWAMGGNWESTLIVTLLGAGREMNVLNWFWVVRDLPSQLDLHNEPWTITYYGITVTNDVTCSGYEAVGGGYLFPIEGEQQSYHRLLTVALAAEP